MLQEYIEIEIYFGQNCRIMYLLFRNDFMEFEFMCCKVDHKNSGMLYPSIYSNE